MHLKRLKDSSFFLKTNETIKPIFYLNPFQKYQINQTLPFSPLRVILPTPHNPAPEALLTFIHTLLALIIILYPVLIIQKEHPQPFFFLPILATAIPSFKMFKLCSLFS